MSEAELHWLRSRLLGGKWEKAQHGALRFRSAVGLVFDPAGHLVRDPDEQIAHAVQMVFDQFDRTGAALAVVKYFRDQHLQFPDRLWGSTHDWEIVGEPLRHSRVLGMLHNPAYARAYVYGRTQTRTTPLPGEAPRIKGRTRAVAPDAWAVVIQEAHPGYITWEQFQRNRARLADNRTYRPEEHRGAVLLLQRPHGGYSPPNGKAL